MSSPQNSDLNKNVNHDSLKDDWKEDDDLWNLLDNASTVQPSDFFSRNVVRATRQLPQQKNSFSTRIIQFVQSHPISIAACFCAVATYSMWPTDTPSHPETSQPSVVVSTPVKKAPATTTAESLPSKKTTASTEVSTNNEVASNFSELIIEETLIAVADDPTLVTRDELVTMLGL